MTIKSETQTVPRPDIVVERSTLPPYNLLLHNDDVNSMDHVVRALVESIPDISSERAAEIMIEAHQTGRAVVLTCPLELAELYRDRLKSFGLRASIEAAY